MVNPAIEGIKGKPDAYFTSPDQNLGGKTTLYYYFLAGRDGKSGSLRIPDNPQPKTLSVSEKRQYLH